MTYEEYYSHLESIWFFSIVNLFCRVDVKENVDGDLARAAVWTAALGMQPSDSLTDMTMS